MLKQKRDQIEDLAETIREIYSIQVPIVDIHNVIRKLGGEVTVSYDPLLLDGKIAKKGDSFEIAINPNITVCRANFTIAHEIGHLFLHMGYQFDPVKWATVTSENLYFRSGSSRKEAEANQFAASLLMPEKDIQSYIERQNQSKIDLIELANYFKVSVPAVKVRCQILGLIENE